MVYSPAGQTMTIDYVMHLVQPVRVPVLPSRTPAFLTALDVLGTASPYIQTTSSTPVNPYRTLAKQISINRSSARPVRALMNLLPTPNYLNTAAITIAFPACASSTPPTFPHLPDPAPSPPPSPYPDFGDISTPIPHLTAHGRCLL